MFADPQSITYDGAKTLNRTGQGIDVGEFRTSDGTIQLKVESTYKGRTRRSARLRFTKITPSPTNPSTNVEVSWSCYLVIDTPATTVDSTEASDTVKALIGWLSASSYAAVTKLVGGES